MRTAVKNIAKTLGLGVVKADRLDQLKCIESECDELFELFARSYGIQNESRAQLKQDIFVLLETGFKKGGFFVEFGATNGVSLSNTYLLESHFEWSGILAEPAVIWHDELKKNRRAFIDTDCVWSESGRTLDFNMVDYSELSTISAFNNRDCHAASRKIGSSYKVNTISLLDLLRRYNAPKCIDYLSIDTEGSEFDILSKFDFDQYNIAIITCEHNFTQDRQKIYDLLTSKCYQRKFSGLSKWDDWYIRTR